MPQRVSTVHVPANAVALLQSVCDCSYQSVLTLSSCLQHVLVHLLKVQEQLYRLQLWLTYDHAVKILCKLQQ
jgi:hypothetical protein